MAIHELHCHSTASDGSLSPAQLVTRASQEGLASICITDHDTIAGIEEAENAAATLDLEVIPGIEIEISHPSGAFHLLGLGVRFHKGILDDILPRIIQDREMRNRTIAKKMGRIGVPGSYADVVKLARGTVVGRPHFAEYLILKGFAVDTADAFERFLGPGQPLYTPREGIPLDEAIEKIHLAGGKAVIAHPSSLHLSWSKLRRELAEWVTLGLDGLEAFHSSTKYRDGLKFQAIARDFGILATAGSDFHHPDQPHKRLGHHSIEQMEIGDEFLEGL